MDFRLKIGISIVSGLLSCLLAEIILQILHVPTTPPYFEWITANKQNQFIPDKNLIYAPYPSSSMVNRYGDGIGFHITEEGMRKGSSKNSNNPHLRILAVGDSFTWGLGVSDEQTMPAVLQALMSERGVSIVVDNAGVEGYSPGQEYIRIKQLLIKHHYDLVLWNINRSDYYDMQQTSLHIVKNGQLVYIPAWLYGLYWEGVIRRLLGNFVLKSKIINLVLNCMQTFDPVQLIQPINNRNLTDKLEYMFSDVGKVTRLVITQTPTDTELLTQKTDSVDKVFDKIIKDVCLEAHLNCLNMNSLIKDKYADKQGSTSTNVLGITDLNELFLKTNEPKGWRHLSPEGNLVYATEIAAYLLNHNLFLDQ